jgi:ABC-type uncharacterized transport system YnjBCD ATPase subunit
MPVTGLAIGNGKVLVSTGRAGCGQESLLSWAAHPDKERSIAGTFAAVTVQYLYRGSWV